MDRAGTGPVILVNVAGACEFFVGEKRICQHQLSKEAWCIGTRHKGGSQPPHWCRAADCKGRYAQPRRYKAATIPGISVDDDLLVDRMCSRCAAGQEQGQEGRALPLECGGCKTHTLQPGDVLVFHGDEKTGVVHGVNRVVEATARAASAAPAPAVFKDAWRYSMQWRFTSRASLRLSARKELEAWLKNVAMHHGFYGLISHLMGAYANGPGSSRPEPEPWRAFMHTFQRDVDAKTPDSAVRQQFARRYDSPAPTLWASGAKMATLKHAFADCARAILHGEERVMDSQVQTKHAQLSHTMSAYNNAEQALMQQLSQHSAGVRPAASGSRGRGTGVDAGAARQLLKSYGIAASAVDTGGASSILQNSTAAAAKKRRGQSSAAGGGFGSGAGRAAASTAAAGAGAGDGDGGGGGSTVNSNVFVRRVLNILIADKGLDVALQTVQRGGGQHYRRPGNGHGPHPGSTQPALVPRPAHQAQRAGEDFDFDEDLQRALAMSLGSDPPHKRAKVAPPTDAHAPWACGACTFINAGDGSSRPSCAVCGSSRL